MSIRYSILLSKDQLALLSEIGDDIHFRQERMYKSLSRIGWSDSKINKAVRSLYGILALAECSIEMEMEGRPCKWRRIDHIYVPGENREAVEVALRTNGLFEKEIGDEDMPVLKAVYGRDRELKARYGTWMIPRFHENEVARRSGRGNASARNSLTRLVGILAKATGRDKRTEGRYGPSNEVYIDMQRWFLPAARVQDAEKLLSKYQGLAEEST